MHRHKRTRLFYKLLVSYAVLLCFAMVVGWVTSFRAIRLLRTEEIQNNLVQLQHARDALDREFTEIMEMVNRLWADHSVQMFAVLDGKESEPEFNYLLYKLLLHLASYRSSNHFVDDFLIRFTRSDTIVRGDESFAVFSLSRDHISGAEIGHAIARQHFAETLDRSGFQLHSDSTQNLDPSHGVSYVRHFPSNRNNDPLFSVVILVGEDKIEERLGSVATNGSHAIMDEGPTRYVCSRDVISEELLAAIPKNRGSGYHIAREPRRVVSYASSHVTDWKLVSVVPQSRAVANTRFLRQFLMLTSLGAFVLGIVSSVLLALNNTKPVRRVISLVRENRKDEELDYASDFELIHKSLRGLLEDNRRLAGMMKEQMPMLRSAFFERLLEGKYHNDVEIAKLASLLGVDMRGDEFGVVIVLIGDPGSDDGSSHFHGYFRAKAVIRDLLRRRYPDRLYLHDRSENEVVLVLTRASDSSDSYVETVEAIASELSAVLRNRHHIRLSFAAGRVRSKLVRISESFRECLLAEELISNNVHSSVQWYEPGSSDICSNLYPLELERSIINNVKAGNAETVEQTLDEWYAERVGEKKQNPELLKVVANDMGCTIYKLLNQMHVANRDDTRDLMRRCERLTNMPTFVTAFEEIKSILVAACGITEANRQSRRTALIQEIMDYIRDNISNVSLNRYLVASEFGMNEHYFSAFFREQSGTTFSKCLEKERIDAAMSLLTNTDLTVARISQNTGYSGPKVFRRAFKRATGVSPGQFRSMVRSPLVGSADGRGV